MITINVHQQVRMLDSKGDEYYKSGDNTGIVVSINRGWYKVWPNRCDVGDTILNFRARDLRVAMNSGSRHLPSGL